MLMFYLFGIFVGSIFMRYWLNNDKTTGILFLIAYSALVITIRINYVIFQNYSLLIIGG